MKLLSGSNFSKTDRLVLLLVLTYSVVNSTLEVVKRHSDGSTSILQWTSIAAIALILIVLVALWHGSRRGSISLGQYGFSLGWGMWVNLGIVALGTVLVIGQIPSTTLPFTVSGFWMTLFAFTEELVFRVYLIRVVSILLSPRRGHVSWAVFLCAALFTALHVFRKDPSQLSGLFLSSVTVGYITYYTRSVLSAAYIHVLSNTVGELGFLGGGVTIAVYLAISLASLLQRGRSVNPVGTR